MIQMTTDVYKAASTCDHQDKDVRTSPDSRPVMLKMMFRQTADCICDTDVWISRQMAGHTRETDDNVQIDSSLDLWYK